MIIHFTARKNTSKVIFAGTFWHTLNKLKVVYLAEYPPSIKKSEPVANELASLAK